MKLNYYCIEHNITHADHDTKENFMSQMIKLMRHV